MATDNYADALAASVLQRAKESARMKELVGRTVRLVSAKGSLDFTKVNGADRAYVIATNGATAQVKIGHVIYHVSVKSLGQPV